MAKWGEPEVEDLRADIGDTNDRFKREELVRLLGRAERLSPNASAPQIVDIACAIGIEQLLSSAARFNDFTINEQQQKRSDIHKQLLATMNAKRQKSHVRLALNLDAGEATQIIQTKLGYNSTRDRSGDEYNVRNQYPRFRRR